MLCPDPQWLHVLHVYSGIKLFSNLQLDHLLTSCIVVAYTLSSLSVLAEFQESCLACRQVYP